MNKGTYKQMRDRKKRKKRFFTFVAILVFVAVGIVTAQVVINKKDSKSDKTMQVEAKAKETEKDNEKEKKQSEVKKEEKKDNEKQKEEKVEKENGTNSAKDGQAFADDGMVVQEISQYKGVKDGKKVAYLTFDDGPSTTVTPKILKVLSENNIKGTFFVVGNTLDKGEKAKELLKEEYDNGHAIAIHSYSHNYNVLYPNRSISADSVMGEFDKTLTLMKGILGQDFNTNVFRFPGGINSWKNREPIKAKLKERGISHIEWNSLSGDAEGKKRDAAGLFNRFKETVNGQEKIVVLMHDTYGKEATAEALPQIIKYLKDQGYEFRTIK